MSTTNPAATPRPSESVSPAIPTTGRWVAIAKGKASPRITGWIEMFHVAGGWVTVPGVSRFVEVSS